MLVLRYSLRWLNLRHLRRFGHCIPPGFEEVADSETLRKTTDYTLAQSRAGLAESLSSNLLLILFFFGGLLPLYDRYIGSLSSGFITTGLLFYLGLFLLQALFDSPFSLYRTFRLENRFGFNTTTPKLWLSDFLKSTLLSLVLLTALIAGALWLIRSAPESWWIWVWGFFALVTFFLMFLSPYLIEPLFFKFEPVRKEKLRGEIEKLMEQAGLRVRAVLQVDASKRSRHSNAYFTGIGRVKRIVLFDTLLEQMEDREILAVLAHEVGHWKKGHIWKRILMSEAGLLIFFYLAHRLLEGGMAGQALGMPEVTFFAETLIVGLLASIALFPLSPILNGLSRRHERQADDFACDLTRDAGAMASALVKLSRENLANLHPHPLFAWFHYSHPPMAERVGNLRSRAEENQPEP